MSGKKGEPPRRPALARQNAVYPLKPAKPQLSKATIWTWRIVFLLLLIHWVWNVVVLVLLGTTFAGPPNSADQILSLIQPTELLLFFRSRLNLWKLSNLVILIACTTLTLDLIAIPTTWFAFRRRRERLFNNLLLWRLIIGGSVLGTDMALMNGAISSIKPDPLLVTGRHLYITHVAMIVTPILMFFIAPQTSPARAVSPSMGQRLRNLRSTMSTSPYRGLGRSSTPPESRSNEYAGRIVDVVTYEEQPAPLPTPPPPPPPLPAARPYGRPGFQGHPGAYAYGSTPPSDRNLYLPIGSAASSPSDSGNYLPGARQGVPYTPFPQYYPSGPTPRGHPAAQRGFPPMAGPSPYAQNVPPYMARGERPYHTAPRPVNVSEAPMYPMNRSPMRSQSARRHM